MEGGAGNRLNKFIGQYRYTTENVEKKASSMIAAVQSSSDVTDFYAQSTDSYSTQYTQARVCVFYGTLVCS